MLVLLKSRDLKISHIHEKINHKRCIQWKFRSEKHLPNRAIHLKALTLTDSEFTIDRLHHIIQESNSILIKPFCDTFTTSSKIHLLVFSHTEQIYTLIETPLPSILNASWINNVQRVLILWCCFIVSMFYQSINKTKD